MSHLRVTPQKKRKNLRAKTAKPFPTSAPSASKQMFICEICQGDHLLFECLENICHNCGEKGHMANKCRLATPIQWEMSKQKDDTSFSKESCIRLFSRDEPTQSPEEWIASNFPGRNKTISNLAEVQQFFQTFKADNPRKFLLFSDDGRSFNVPRGYNHSSEPLAKTLCYLDADQLMEFLATNGNFSRISYNKQGEVAKTIYQLAMEMKGKEIFLDIFVMIPKSVTTNSITTVLHM